MNNRNINDAELIEQTCISSFEINGDDSSDEEGLVQAAKAYDFITQYNNYKAQQPDFLKTADIGGLSFAAYSSGLSLLYSREVNKYYYEKKKSMGSCVIKAKDSLETSLVSWIRDSLYSALVSNGYPELIKTEIINFLEKNEPLLNQTAQAFLIKKMDVFKQRYELKLLPCLENVCQVLFEKCISHIEKTIEESYAIPFTLEQIASDEKIKSTIKDQAKEYLISIKLVKEEKLVDKKTRTPIIKEILELNSTTLFKKEILTRINDTKSQNINTILQSLISDLTLFLIKRHINQELEKDNPFVKVSDANAQTYQLTRKPDIKATWILKANPNILNNHLPSAWNTVLLEEWKKTFRSELPKKLREKQAIYKIRLIRPLLEDTFTLKSANSHEFLANLRLTYRDQKRRIKNKNDANNNSSECFQRSYQFGNFKKLALETQEITRHKARKDLIINLQTYEKIFIEWKRLCDSINNKPDINSLITDADLARWIKNLIQHKAKVLTYENGEEISFDHEDEEELKKFLVNFTYLLFGCEAARNPATLVTTPLMLDRIIQKKLTWQNAINKMEKNGNDERHIKYGGGEMPMSMGSCKKEKNANEKNKKQIKIASEPVAASRNLQNHYSLFAQKSYFYPGEPLSKNNSKDNFKIAELARRENTMITNWISEIAKPEQDPRDDEKVKLVDQAVKSFYFGV